MAKALVARLHDDRRFRERAIFVVSGFIATVSTIGIVFLMNYTTPVSG